MRVFLSYSRKDRGFVTKINYTLQSQRFETFLDTQDIKPGSSIPERIEKGLESSQVVLVFLSRHSAASEWVSTEWRSVLANHLSGGTRQLLVLRLDESAVPLLLASFRYVDFRNGTEYEESLSELIRHLRQVRSEHLGEKDDVRRPSEMSLVDYTKELLDDLEGEYLSFPLHKRLPIVGSLRKISRSGKQVRLGAYRPSKGGERRTASQLRVRSIYDHILSVAHSGDCLLPHIDCEVDDQQLTDLALCIAYHEVNEIILGDIPSYTSLSSKSRNRARVYAEERLRSVPPIEREETANKLIRMFLSDKHRYALEHVTELLLTKRPRPVFPVFKALDKLDPIIATWRYLHHYRGLLGPDPKGFNTRMKDFYENPELRSFIQEYSLGSTLMDLASYLQSRRYSWDYYVEGSSVFNKPGLQKRLSALPGEVFRNLIEGVSLFSSDK